MIFPKSGNKIWFNRAFLYYSRYSKDPEFTRDFYWLIKEIGLIQEHISHPKQDNP